MFRKICMLLCFCCLIATVGCKSKKKAVSSRKKIEKVRTVEKGVSKPQKEISEATVIKTPPANATYTQVVEVYIDNYSTIAMEEMRQYAIPASITLAQGILESGAGRGELTKKANNHFGIKCHSNWTGGKVYHDDDEKGECFRKYKDSKYSFRDHSLFLSERSRYQNLFKLKIEDYKGWARGLKKAGYATDPKYPNKLISIIERYDLTQYDSQVLGNEGSAVGSSSESTETYTVKKGDTLYSISRRFNTTVEALKEYNKLQSNDILIGQILYLQPIKGR